MARLAQIIAFVQYLMKVVPTAMVGNLVALAKAAIPLPASMAELPAWKEKLVVTGPLGAFLGDVAGLFLPETTPEPVLGVPPVGAECPCPGPCPCGNAEIEQMLMQTDHVVTASASTVNAVPWVELVTVLWQLGQPALEALINWFKSREQA